MLPPSESRRITIIGTFASTREVCPYRRTT